jgi:hypothetical protein
MAGADSHESRLDPHLEGLELEALLRSSADPRLVASRLKAFARTSSLPAGERFRACMLLAAAAEDLLSEELAADAYAAAQSVNGIGDAVRYRLEFEVVYHASFGDLDFAARSARDLLALATGQSSSAAECRMRLTSGSGLLRAGLLEGVDTLETCYRIASDHHLITAQYRAASHLAGFLRDSRELDQSLVWQERAAAAFELLQGREKLAGFFSNCALFAMAAGDLKAAQQWVSRANAEVPSVQVGSAGLHFRALELRIRQLMDADDCQDGELEELLDAHLRYRVFAHHDEVMEVVWHGLGRKGRVCQANDLLDAYLNTHRRLRWPITQGLAEIAEEHGILRPACRPDAGFRG